MQKSVASGWYLVKGKALGTQEVQAQLHALSWPPPYVNSANTACSLPAKFYTSSSKPCQPAMSGYFMGWPTGAGWSQWLAEHMKCAPTIAT